MIWHNGCQGNILTDITGTGGWGEMKQISKLTLVQPKNKFRKKMLRRDAGGGEPGEIITDLKNAMTLFYLALETLRSSLDQPAISAKRIEELKSLTGRIHAQMDRLLELL